MKAKVSKLCPKVSKLDIVSANIIESESCMGESCIATVPSLLYPLLYF